VGGGMVFAFNAWVNCPDDILVVGMQLALLGRAMTFSAVISQEIVLQHPERQNFVEWMLYSLIFLIMDYRTLQYYSNECWIFFGLMIHFTLFFPTSTETALGYLLIYGLFYFFLWDPLNIFEWHMRRRKVALYVTSVVVSLCFALLTWQNHLNFGVATSISPLYYLLEQVWWWNYSHFP
jgi:hypothetical protein